MKTKIIPLGARVLIKPFTEEDLRKGESKSKKFNFVLPDSIIEEKSAQGKVVAVGKEVKGVKVGEVVVFSKYSYDEVEEFYLVKEENILAIIK